MKYNSIMTQVEKASEKEVEHYANEYDNQYEIKEL